MRNIVRGSVSVLALGLAAGAFATAAGAQTASRDGIGDLLKRAPDATTQMAQSQAGGQKAAPGTSATGRRHRKPTAPDKQAAPEKDVREGDPGFEQAQRLMKAIDAILQDTAKNRGEAKKLPSESDFLMKPLWTETREDREKKIRDLLDAAMGIVTDVPVVEVQSKIEGLRKNMRDLDDRIVALREKQLTAPKDGVLPGYITDTVDSLAKDIEESKKPSRATARKSPRPRRKFARRSTRPASSSRPSRSTCCSTACFPATWCGWWRCSIPPS